MKLCTHCLTRNAEPKDYINQDEPDYCDICHHASRIAFTSVDDARSSIKHACIDTIYMAAKFELTRGGQKRTVMMKMLRARLRKLTGISTLTFPGEPPSV